MKLFLLPALLVSLVACQSTEGTSSAVAEGSRPEFDLGAFSVSLVVKDLAASRGFYEKLGFAVTGGDAAQDWLVLRNGTTTIGLFQGMFERNMLTFNPGWGSNATPLASFTDVRELQHELKGAGVSLVLETDEDGTGPAHIMLVDPDGNPILIDQHVAAPSLD